MLDRLTGAVDRELDVSEAVLADPLTLRRLKARRVARAVLAELRNPTDAMLAAGFQAQWTPDSIGAIWQAMVDAIRDEGP
jgi:hypothetical protein